MRGSRIVATLSNFLAWDQGSFAVFILLVYAHLNH
jgi:hypothetical protein